MKNILIISGGSVDYNWALSWLKSKRFDYVIAADHGLEHAKKLGIRVDFVLGDYDSVDKNILDEYLGNAEIVQYPAEKDFTDTELAFYKAFEEKADDISIIGATGSRYDHALNNIFLLKQAIERHIECAIYDANNKIYLKSESFVIDKKRQFGNYLSFVSMTPDVELTLKGVRYPLENYKLRQGVSICQSNEIIKEHAEITVKNGIVIVFETKD